MDQSFEEEIDENVRFCEELMKRNPNFVPKEPDLAFDDLFGGMDDSTQGIPVPSSILGLDEPEWNANTEPGSVVNPQPVVKPQPVVTSQPVIKLEPVVKPESVPTPASKPSPKAVPISEPLAGKEKGSSALKTIRNFCLCVVIAAAVAFLIITFVANHTMVEGSSMNPTLQNGDHLVIEKVSYLIEKPKRFDIIVFEHSASANYIKRVIGLPGENVRIEEGKIYINEAPLNDTYNDGALVDSGIAAETIHLGVDEYFVLGDNRDGSEDSRSESVGPVKADKIKGRAWLRVMPFEKFGMLE